MTMWHGTITLFAALDQLTGKLISRTEASHTHVEWLRFLKQIDRETPHDLDLHLIADDYATHKHPKVRAWLEKRPRFKMHYTPTSSSWLNLVERFFADLTGDVIRAGSFSSVNDLVRDIKAYLAECGGQRVPISWQRSNVHALHSTRPKRHELLEAN
jgi:transposase